MLEKIDAKNALIQTVLQPGRPAGADTPEAGLLLAVILEAIKHYWTWHWTTHGLVPPQELLPVQLYEFSTARSFLFYSEWPFKNYCEIVGICPDRLRNRVIHLRNNPVEGLPILTALAKERE